MFSQHKLMIASVFKCGWISNIAYFFIKSCYNV